MGVVLPAVDPVESYPHGEFATQFSAQYVFSSRVCLVEPVIENLKDEGAHLILVLHRFKINLRKKRPSAFNCIYEAGELTIFVDAR